MSQLMCLSTRACRMSNKQEELEATVQLANYNQITITKTWWNKSHEWSTSTDGCKMLQRDPQRRSGETAALCVKKKLIDCTELPLKHSNEQVGSLWVKIRDQANKGNFVAGVYYKQPDQGESVDKVFLLHTCGLWSCWKTSITLAPAGKAAQQAVSNPEDCWRVHQG